MDLELKKRFPHAKVEVLTDQPEVAIVTATDSYIPIEEFKIVFQFIGSLVKNQGIQKLIFDKSQLTVFHQPSMEWYFIDWKEEMYDYGLKVHRKILPDDPVFRQSVMLGRETISRKFPKGKYNLMDIRYADSLDEAIAH
jgi:hypothetical protein